MTVTLTEGTLDLASSNETAQMHWRSVSDGSSTARDPYSANRRDFLIREVNVPGQSAAEGSFPRNLVSCSERSSSPIAIWTFFQHQ